MTPELWRRLQELLPAALRIPPSKRSSYLDRICSGQPELRRELEGLLRVDTKNVAFLEQPLLVHLGHYAEHDLTGQHAGPYRILRELGSGGMGLVFLATRDDGQLERNVAIKVLPSSIARPSTVRRFKQEFQILARLHHSNIAALYEPGRMADGRLFYAMEFVDGMHITDYCREASLPVSQRLLLFQKLCAAVQYSHQNLVVHGDIKPGNLLVTKDGEPKLLDFGIATLLSTKDGSPLPTFSGSHRPFTPHYASPEQENGAPLTTLSDVYSLGALLYELLTGQPPEANRRGEEIEKPSSVVLHRWEPKVSASKALQANDSPTAQPDRSKLRRQLHGDLDAIVLKALETKPSERYGSPQELWADIANHLKGSPVLARQGARLYLMRKFIRRHRIEVSAAAFIFLLLVGFAMFMVHQQRETARERDRAESVTEFMVDVIEAANPAEELGAEPTARELLDAARSRIVFDLAKSPGVRADMLLAIGRSYRGLALLPEARETLQQALSLEDFDTRRPSPRRAFILRYLGLVEMDQGNYRFAKSRFQDAIGEYDEKALHGKDRQDLELDLAELNYLAGHPGTADILCQGVLNNAETRQIRARALEILATLKRENALYDEALADLKVARELRLTEVSSFHPSVLDNWKEVASVYSYKGEQKKALEIINDVFRRQEQAFGPGHPVVASTLQDWASALLEVGDDEQAKVLIRRSLEIHERSFGRVNRRVAVDLAQLARVHKNSGEFMKAETLLREALSILEQTVGARHQVTAYVLSDLGSLKVDLDQLDEGEALLRRATQIVREQGDDIRLPDDRILIRLAYALEQQRKFSEADALYKEVIDIRRTLFGQEDKDTALVLGNIGLSYLKRGWAARAVAYIGHGCEMLSRTEGTEGRNYPICLVNLSSAFVMQGKLGEAEKKAREALALDRRLYGEKHPATSADSVTLAMVLNGRGSYGEACKLARPALESLRSAYGEEHARVAGAKSILGECLAGLGQVAEAEPLLIAGYTRLKEVRGLEAYTTQNAARRLALYYEKVGKLTAAQAIRRDAAMGASRAKE
jgi:serine/threonine protein kinase